MSPGDKQVGGSPCWKDLPADIKTFKKNCICPISYHFCKDRERLSASLAGQQSSRQSSPVMTTSTLTACRPWFTRCHPGHPKKASLLTPSLPWCHLKTTNKSAKFEILTSFCCCFALACERLCIKTHGIESRWVTGPENILFAGASVHLSARTFYRLGQWRG